VSLFIKSDDLGDFLKVAVQPCFWVTAPRFAKQIEKQAPKFSQRRAERRAQRQAKKQPSGSTRCARSDLLAPAPADFKKQNPLLTMGQPSARKLALLKRRNRAF